MEWPIHYNLIVYGIWNVMDKKDRKLQETFNDMCAHEVCEATRPAASLSCPRMLMRWEAHCRTVRHLHKTSLWLFAIVIKDLQTLYVMSQWIERLKTFAKWTPNVHCADNQPSISPVQAFAILHWKYNSFSQKDVMKTVIAAGVLTLSQCGKGNKRMFDLYCNMIKK